MSKIQELYQDDEDIILLSYSVMPWVDTVDKIKEYASEKNIIDNKWHLLTGDKNEIYNLARTSYFADEDFKKTKDEDEFIHTENFILVDKKGRIRGVYNGTLALEIERLKRHINLLKNEV
jgi:protein SCO1/2